MREVMMKMRIQKWGNSLAFRIPKSLAAEAGLFADASVEMSVVDGKLFIRPISAKTPTLEQLVRGITAENLHGEWAAGRALGKEVW
jgi:antitoxin MazE